MDSTEIRNKLWKVLSQAEEFFDKLAFQASDVGSEDWENNLVNIAERISGIRRRGPYRKAIAIVETSQEYCALKGRL